MLVCLPNNNNNNKQKLTAPKSTTKNVHKKNK